MDRKEQLEWDNLLGNLTKIFGKRPDLNGVLYLIGVQELGMGFRPFSKEEKQDLMHVGVCTLLAPLGFYEFTGKDDQGWPHWEQKGMVPHLNLIEQETVLKTQAIVYFKSYF